MPLIRSSVYKHCFTLPEPQLHQPYPCQPTHQYPSARESIAAPYLLPACAQLNPHQVWPFNHVTSFLPRCSCARSLPYEQYSRPSHEMKRKLLIACNGYTAYCHHPASSLVVCRTRYQSSEALFLIPVYAIGANLMDWGTSLCST